MEKALDQLSLKEIIGHSIKSEEQSRRFYGKFVETGKGELVPERFESLMDDERLHKRILLKLHENLYDDRDFTVPEGDNLPPHEDFENLENVENLIDALGKAITNENNAIRIYEYLSEEYPDHSSVFGYLAAMEHGHYESLKKEKGLYERGTESTDREGIAEGIWRRLGLEGM